MKHTDCNLTQRRRRPRRRLLAAAVPAVLLFAVSCETPATPDPVIRPIRHVLARAAEPERTRSFSGVARSGVQSRLSFRVAGAVARVAVGVGDRVTVGTLIAELDPIDYELQTREAEAALRQARARAGNAEAELRRTRSLFENDNASRTDLDAASAAAESAAAQVESAIQRLDLTRRQVEHTHLLAPAAGAIADVLVEANENVSPGQPVVVLAADGRPEVGFAVPESLIRRIREGMPAGVAFDAIPGERFEGAVTEVGVASTAVGTTFPVTVRLDADSSEIRSGMAAVVDLAFADEEASASVVVPGRAVGEDRDGRFVLVAEPVEDGLAVVRRQAVLIGSFAPGGLQIVAGLSDGDLVVTAGLSHLRDGDRVRLGAAADAN